MQIRGQINKKELGEKSNLTTIGWLGGAPRYGKLKRSFKQGFPHPANGKNKRAGHQLISEYHNLTKTTSGKMRGKVYCYSLGMAGTIKKGHAVQGARKNHQSPPLGQICDGPATKERLWSAGGMNPGGSLLRGGGKKLQKATGWSPRSKKRRRVKKTVQKRKKPSHAPPTRAGTRERTQLRRGKEKEMCRAQGRVLRKKKGMCRPALPRVIGGRRMKSGDPPERTVPGTPINGIEKNVHPQERGWRAARKEGSRKKEQGDLQYSPLEILQTREGAQRRLLTSCPARVDHGHGGGNSLCQEAIIESLRGEGGSESGSARCSVAAMCREWASQKGQTFRKRRGCHVCPGEKIF